MNCCYSRSTARTGADGSGGFAYFETERELGYLVEAIEPATG